MAASSCRRGVCMKMSRDTEVMIGRIMTASTTATVATVREGLSATDGSLSDPSKM